MNTRDNPSSRQDILKSKCNLPESQYQQMLGLLASLTLAERAMLGDPDFITEDEADLIICARRSGERTAPPGDVLKEMGIPPRRRRSA